MFKKLLFIFLTSLIFLFSSNIKALTFSNDIKMEKLDAYFSGNNIVEYLEEKSKQWYNMNDYIFSYTGSKIAYLKKCERDNKYLSAWTGLEKITYLTNYQLGQKISKERIYGTSFITCSIHKSYGENNKGELDQNFNVMKRFINENYGENELIKLYDHLLFYLESKPDFFEKNEIKFYKNYFNELKQNISDKTDNKNKKDEIKDEETNTLNKSEKKPKTKVDGKLTISLEEAKSILTLVQQFLPSNPSEFDVVALTTLIQKNKEVLQDNWSNQQQDNFKELYDFLYQSNAFSSFKIAKDKEVQKAKEEAINQEKQLLDQNISLLKDYLTKNMLSDDAPIVLEMIKESESLKSSENIERLKKINRKINSFLSEKNPKELNIQNDKNSSLNIENKINDVLNVFDKNDNKSDLQGLEDDQNFKAEKDNVVSNSYVNFEDESVYGPCAFGVCLYDKLENVIKNKKTSNCKYENLEGVFKGDRYYKGDEFRASLITDSYDGKWCEFAHPSNLDLSLVYELDFETNEILGRNILSFQHAIIINDESYSAFKNVKSYCSLPFRFHGRFVSKGGHTVVITALPDMNMEYFVSDIFVQFNNYNKKVQTLNGHEEYQLKIFETLIKRYETTFLNIRDQYDKYEAPDDFQNDDDEIILKDRFFQDNKSYNIRMWDGFNRNKLWGTPKRMMTAEMLITNDVRYTTYNLPGDLTEVEFDAVMSSEEFDYLSSVASKISQSDYCRDLSQGPEVDID